MPPEVDAVEELDVVKPLTEREGIIPLSTLVTVENHTNTTLILKYDNTEWRVPANDRAAIPYFCAVLWFGDPRAHDDPNDKRIRHRTRELTRLTVKWGFYDRDDWETAIPNVTIKDAAGNELIFPAQDPTGEKSDPGARERKQAANQQALFMDELERIRDENAEMRADLARIREQQRAQVEARAPERTDTPAVEPDDHDLDLGTIPNVPNVGETSDPGDGGPRDAAPDDLDDVLNDNDDSLPIDDDTPTELADMLDPIEDGDEGPGEGDGIEDADDVVDDDEDDEDDDGDDKGGES